MLAIALLLVASPAPEEVLITVAREAHARGDRAERDRALDGWATLGVPEALPAGLEPEATAAIAWAAEHGRLRVTATRGVDQVALAIADPAGLVGYTVVRVLAAEGEERGLIRDDTSPEGHPVYRAEAPIPPDADIEVELYMTRYGGQVPLKRIVLSGSSPLPPAAPDPQKGLRRRASTAAVEEDLTPWWLIAAGIVAAALVGGAVWQETR